MNTDDLFLLVIFITVVSGVLTVGAIFADLYTAWKQRHKG